MAEVIKKPSLETTKPQKLIIRATVQKQQAHSKRKLKGITKLVQDVTLAQILKKARA